ncbi:hypothetical protein Q9233_013531 [Columba guinea]|nr:hypothetical protein Q9233_013531 [Columba guinea]
MGNRDAPASSPPPPPPPHCQLPRRLARAPSPALSRRRGQSAGKAAWLPPCPHPVPPSLVTGRCINPLPRRIPPPRETLILWPPGREPAASDSPGLCAPAADHPPTPDPRSLPRGAPSDGSHQPLPFATRPRMSEKRVEEAPAELSAKEMKEKKEKVEEKTAHKEKKKEIVEVMRKMEQKRMKKRILMMWMKKKKVVMRMKKEMRMVKSRMVMQKKDLQRKKRMKWIQRDRRQKMGLQLEFSLPISSVPSISPPPFQPVLALSISLWLHTISDEGRLEMLSNREDSCFLLTRRSSPSVTFPSSEIIPDPTSLQLCPIYK